MRTIPKVLAITALLALGAALFAGPKPDSGEEFPAPQLAHLDSLVGVWKVEQKHFDPSGAVIATVEGTEEITWILDKHAIQRVYRTKYAGSAFEAMGLLTWSDAAKRFEGTWFDNASTAGPTQVTGEWKEATRDFVFTLQGADAQGPTHYNIADRFQSDSVRVATTYRVQKTEVIKVSETKYTRTTPCPARVRILFEDS